jgi:hypothetical protein
MGAKAESLRGIRPWNGPIRAQSRHPSRQQQYAQTRIPPARSLAQKHIAKQGPDAKPCAAMKALHLLLCAGLLMPAVSPKADAQTIRINLNREKKEVSLDWLLDEENLFALAPDDFEKKAGSRHFVWQDKERTRARFNPDKFKYKLKDKDVGEILVNFKDGKVVSVAISVLNKGDENSIITQSEFTQAVANVRAVLGGASGVKEEARRKEELLSPKSAGAVWRGKKALYIGEWLFLPEKIENIDGWSWKIKAHGEFVRIRLMPPQVQLGVQLAKVRTTMTRPLLAARVKREGNTKAIIEGIPMVDQGSKGYCAVASFERVLRHYGADVDMHDLANVAETYGGTDPQKMKTAILRMAQKLSLKAREILFLKQKQYEILFKNYNVTAKKDGKTEVDLDQLKEWGYVDWSSVDPVTLKTFRCTNQDYIKFKQEVVSSVSKGIPILWALQLGMYWEERLDESFEANRYAINKDSSDESKEAEEEAKEDAEERKKEFEELRKKNPRPPEHMIGGHMRLIVGYDTKYSLIYYTDSWGPGHELKSMPIDQAWATTLALWALEPN